MAKAKKRYQNLKEAVLFEATVVLPYKPIPQDAPDEVVKDLLSRGLIKEISAKEASLLEEEVTEQAKSSEEAKKAKLENARKKKGTKLKRVGRWNINPRTLVGKTLDQLNIMIAERDTKAPRFETIEEAAAFLSQDFRGE